MIDILTNDIALKTQSKEFVRSMSVDIEYAEKQIDE